ncbi:cap-specific mRNA (nucleoside-2'-O-)-methyltransferase 1 isoform X2 [Odontomachus brunneus]|nr:cap-specific mRNA (nucleoside-2'-O-)-methyltransferase 1 isoform X2 [Odontomachus brunneus]
MTERAKERKSERVFGTEVLGIDEFNEHPPHLDSIGPIRYIPLPEPVYYSKRKMEYKEYISSSSDDDNTNVCDQHCDDSTHNQVSTSDPDESVSQSSKKIKLDENESKTSGVSYIDKTQRMMEKMGYHSGTGLGKHGQGRVEPIELFMQRGRRGFGHSAPELKEASLKWNPQDEVIEVIEDIEWLQNRHPRTLTINDIMREQHWMTIGPKKKTIDDETTFCNSEMMAQLINSKTMFDVLNKIEMRKARTRSNPYETIRTAGFLNRAAVKMANINKACNFMFTDWENLNDELLYFADVCAGPGGFSEYILSRKKWHAKGFGFTLKNENDFKLDEFYAGPCETFHPFYGSNDNGDVYDSENQIEFRQLIMKHTNGKGVHFMMSDGGFSVEGQENIQEILSKQLYLAQCLIALMIVRTGGHFVTKLFDLFTPFSVGLVYLMYRCFDSICIFKPNSSRPANSERYLICKGKKADTEVVMSYLMDTNAVMSQLSKKDENDVTHLVPLSELEADETFIKYLRESNDTLGKRQIVNLLKIAAFCEDPSLNEPKQTEMRKLCLQYWDLPDKSRMRPYNVKPQDKVREMLNDTTGFIGHDAQKLTKEIASTTILNQPYDWYWIPCSSGQYVDEDKMATFYLGLGRRRVYRYVKSKWESIGEVKLELPPNTLVYAELVYESKWTGKYFTKSRALHILDAYMLGGEDVSMRYITHRHKLIKKFCDALWKPTPHDYVCVRPKEIHMFDPNVDKKLRISQRRVKSMSTPYEIQKNTLECDKDIDRLEPLYFGLNSVLFLRSTARPWTRYVSQRTNYTYVFNPERNLKEYERCRPRAAEASFKEAFEGRIVWNWPQDNTLNMSTLVEMLKKPQK